jgi:hypothetical protein
MSKSLTKKIPVAFCDIKGPVYFEFILQGQRVNQAYNVEILTRLHEAVSRNDWILRHDNAPTHKAVSFKQFLYHTSITEMEQSLCSPNLAPNDFCLYPNVKPALK